LTTTETTEVTETNDTEQTPETGLTHDHTHEGHSQAPQAGPSLNPELMREIEVEVPADEVSKSFRTVVKRYQKMARIPGFRAGKVPESLVRTKFAKEVRQEVMEALISERFRRALEEQKLQPVSEPQLLDMFLVDGQPLRFKAAFEVLPQFEIAGYDSVPVTKPETELTEEEFQAELRGTLERYTTVEPVEEDRGLADGDWAEITFRGEGKPLAQTVTEDGVMASEADTEPITGEDVLVEIGGKNTLAAFNEALRGAKVGQEMTFEVAYPEDFGERRLAGQTVGYDVAVKAIKRKVLPERDEELAKQLGDYDSWEDFESTVRSRVADRKREALLNNARNRMLDEIVSKYHFPVPESFVQQQVDARLERGLRALAQQGMKPEDMRKMDFAGMRDSQRAEAEREVRASLVIDRIADAENVVVEDGELDNELMMISLQSREPLETLRERLAGDGGLERIREQMRREKTGAVLYEKLAS
jgi:trigger factor